MLQRRRVAVNSTLGPCSFCCRGYARPAPRSLEKSTRKRRVPSATRSVDALGQKAGSAPSFSEPEPEPWFLKEGGLRFRCNPGCGRCCTGPPGAVYFTEAEAQNIAKHLNLSIRDFYLTHARRQWGRWSLKEVDHRDAPDGKLDCEFLQRNSGTGAGLCSIHNVRPQQCRSYPFWPSLVASQEAWDNEAAECPGIVSFCMLLCQLYGCV